MCKYTAHKLKPNITWLLYYKEKGKALGMVYILVIRICKRYTEEWIKH